VSAGAIGPRPEGKSARGGDAVAAPGDQTLTSKLQTPPPYLGRKGVALLKTTTVGDHPAAGTRLPGLAGKIVPCIAGGKRRVLPAGWSDRT
jgi:hypothetical protein